jgi:hypothetical protein
MRFWFASQLLDSLRKSISEDFTSPVILRAVGEQDDAYVRLAANSAGLGMAPTKLLAQREATTTT